MKTESTQDWFVKMFDQALTGILIIFHTGARS